MNHTNLFKNQTHPISLKNNYNIKKLNKQKNSRKGIN
jgi:hypothetical protein